MITVSRWQERFRNVPSGACQTPDVGAGQKVFSYYTLRGEAANCGKKPRRRESEALSSFVGMAALTGGPFRVTGKK